MGNERIRTEHNCVPRNIVNVQGRMLLGYNVRFALKKQVVIDDVFSLHQFAQVEDGFDLAATTDGAEFLAISPNVVCWEGQHVTLLVLTVPVALCMVLGVPAIYCYVLFYLVPKAVCSMLPLVRTSTDPVARTRPLLATTRLWRLRR